MTTCGGGVTVRRRRTPAETQTVRRLIDLPLPAVETVLVSPLLFGPGRATVLDDGGVLRIDDPFEPVGVWPVSTWRATATLRRRAAIARRALVRIEVAEWSHGGCELTVVPVSRHVALWSVRRQRRYYTLAHDVADHLARSIAQAARRRHDRHLRAVVASGDTDRTAVLARAD